MTERDSDLEARWRALSREEPPAALDDAIRAAAHRAVAAKPQSTARSPKSRAPWASWAPLAAAASIGAIAIGVWQLSPKEFDETRMVASDAPRSAPAAAPAAQAPAPAAAPTVAAPEPALAAPAPAAPAAKPDRLATPPNAPARKEAASAVAQGEAPAVAGHVAPGVPSEAPEAARIAVPDAARNDAPAAPAQDRARDATSAGGFAGAPPVKSLDALSDKRKDSAAPMTERQVAGAPRPLPPPASASASASASARAPANSAEVDAMQPQTIEDFIAAIERARAGHRDADAEALLQAMRVRFSDADARLPATLREWAAQVPRR